jgi:tetratricopeptide (TPR) repeat protein
MPISMVYSNYGATYTKLQDWEQAIEYFEKALEICNELNVPYNCGCVYYEYGIMHNQMGDHYMARDRWTIALDIFKSIQNNDMVKKVEKELSGLMTGSDG